MFTTPGAIQYIWKHNCCPLDPAISPLYQQLNEAAWYYFLCKVMDLFVTVFFVLRKKQSHVTYLHVYHHSNMAILSWVYLKYIKAEQAVMIGWFDALLHTILYAYYFLSTLGPQMQKYLWWKRYITQSRILQLATLIIYITYLMLGNCRIPKLFSVLMLFHGGIFLILFTNFYIKSYFFKNHYTQDKINGTMSSEVKKGEKVQ